MNYLEELDCAVSVGIPIDILGQLHADPDSVVTLEAYDDGGQPYLISLRIEAEL